MNVVTLCCTLNEERNIGRFCEVYSRFVDHVVVCDGGSTDKTVEIASSFSKVQIVNFEEQMDFGGIKWNPKTKQYNFGLRAAQELDPDWITVDDCDSVPTLRLQDDIRMLMRATWSNVIGVQRLYIIGEDDYFPSLSTRGYYGWAWRCEEVDTSYNEKQYTGLPRVNFPAMDTWHKIDPPYGLLHYGWPDAETAKMKTERYHAIGKLPAHGTAIPEYAGTPVPLPGWAKWKE